MKKLVTKTQVNKYIYSFYLPIILSKLDLHVPETASDFTKLSYAVFLLSFIAGIIKIVGYLTALFILEKGEYEVKYPRFSRYIKTYKTGNVLFI